MGEHTVLEVVTARLQEVDLHLGNAVNEGGNTPAILEIICAVEQLRQAVALIAKTTTRGIYP